MIKGRNGGYEPYIGVLASNRYSSSSGLLTASHKRIPKFEEVGVAHMRDAQVCRSTLRASFGRWVSFAEARFLFIKLYVDLCHIKR